jgi:hypothetical protein
MLRDNPLYKLAFENDTVRLYVPEDLTNYHKSREVAMSAQERYSNGGISKDLLQALAADALERCNKQLDTNTLRTDMAVLWNNILARTKEPVDDDCAVRMGAIACFLEDENPNKVEDAWTRKKLMLAKEYPDVYAFFLNMGIAFTPAYNSLLRGLNVQDYLNKREEMLKGLTLSTLS